MKAAAWGVRDLTVRHGRRVLLDGVDLEVPAGAVTAIVGGDGAGKTTLLRALAGVLRVSAGEVRRPARTRIGFVSGAAGLYEDLTVDENIAFVAGAYGLRGAELAARRRELLERTGLSDTGKRLAGRLSGGMRQKLAVALAMLHRPQLLILDEPTTGVDPVSRVDLWRLIAAAAAGGAAVVVSTTYVDEASRAAQVLVLDGGRALATGGPATVGADLHGAGVARQGPAPAHEAETGAAPAATSRPPAAGLGAAAARSSVPLAAAEDVRRTFGRAAAVADVTLAVRPGEIVGLLGANGAGKTTLIRMLLGLLRPTSGRVELFGRAPSRATRGRLGYVPQGLGLWEDLSVAENLAFSARAFGGEPPALAPDLAVASSTLVRDLPLGLRRRLAFAAALAHKPELLVLDEPTSGVDPAARRRLWLTIHDAVDAGAGALVTTHDLSEAGECDRLVVMATGRVVATGRLDEIVSGHAVAVTAARWEAAFAALEAAGLRAALVGRTLRVPGDQVALVRAALDARGVGAALALVPATFEETFVALSRAGAAGAPALALSPTPERNHP